MGRLSEYEEDDEVGRAVMLRDKAALQRILAGEEAEDGELGKKVRELLASEEPPEALREALDAGAEYLSAGQLFAGAGAAWAWFRKQLLGPGPGSLATGGATGEGDGR